MEESFVERFQTLHLSPSIDDFTFILPNVCLKISFTLVGWGVAFVAC
jgi:hypothetical protein